MGKPQVKQALRSDSCLAEDIVESRGSFVSVITPTFNHERFIRQCVGSIMAQTYDNWEQIILDDGSTDRTGEIVAGFKDERIRYFRQENKGIGALAETYNQALFLCRGDLVAILEGDDWWPTEKLSSMVRAFDDPEVVLTFGHTYETDVNGVMAERLSRTTRSRARLPRAILFNEPVGSATACLLSVSGQTLIPPSTVIIRRTALQSIGGFQHVPGNSPVDVPTFLRLSRIGKFHYFNQFLGYRRYHLSSATIQFLDTMTNAAMRFALMSAADPKFGLSDEQRKSVEQSWNAVRFSAEFSRGRICLIKRETKQARMHFSTAFGARDSYLVVASALGWVLSWLRTDMEWVVRMAGRPTVSVSTT